MIRNNRDFAKKKQKLMTYCSVFQSFHTNFIRFKDFFYVEFKKWLRMSWVSVLGEIIISKVAMLKQFFA